MPFDMAATFTARALLQAHELEQLGPLGGAAVRAGEVLVERHQLVGREPVGEAEQLGQVADGRSGGRRAHRGALDLRPAAARAHEAAGDLREGRLAGAVRSQQAEQLAALNREIHAAERHRGAVALLERLAGEDGRHRAECRKLRGCC